MAATMATSMAVLSPKCFAKATAKPTKPVSLPLLSLQNLPKGLSATAPLTGTAVAGAVFSALAAADPAFAAQQLAEIADGDNRGLALLLPLIPAILWVLYNILQPALNPKSTKMRSTKGVVDGLAMAGFFQPAEAADNKGQLLLFVVAPAITWVLYNILQPALK